VLGVAFLTMLREPSTDREPSPENALHWKFAKGLGPPPWGARTKSRVRTRPLATKQDDSAPCGGAHPLERRTPTCHPPGTSDITRSGRLLPVPAQQVCRDESRLGGYFESGSRIRPTA
jgi:hypothetical protein